MPLEDNKFGKFGMLRRLSLAFCTLPLAWGILSSSALPAGADDLRLSGTFLQGKACKGDGTDPRALVVTITDEEIKHRQGVCTISDKRVNGDKLTVNATCKSRNGNVLAGDVTFTRRDADTFDMIDQDQTYKAVLHRCPANGNTAAQ
jgi:hypothetical protein